MTSARHEVEVLADNVGALLGYRELARLLNIGLRTCRRWVADGTLPPPDLRLRGIVRWRPATIEHWLDQQGGRR